MVITKDTQNAQSVYLTEKEAKLIAIAVLTNNSFITMCNDVTNEKAYIYIKSFQEIQELVREKIKSTNK